MVSLGLMGLYSHSEGSIDMTGEQSGEQTRFTAD